MKILVLTSSYPKNENDEVIKFVKNQIDAFKKYCTKTDYFVLTPFLNDGHLVEKDYDVNIFRFHYFFKKFENLNNKGIMTSIKKNKFNLIIIPFYFISQVFNTIKLYKDIKPDFIYAHWITTQGIVALIIKKLYKVPYSLTTHAHDGTILLKFPFFGRYLLNSIIENSYSWTSDSLNTEKQVLDNIDNKNAAKSKSLVAPMFFDSDKYDFVKEDPVVEGFTIEKKKKYILFIGRFSKKKGVENFLDLIFKELKEMKHVTILLAGEGPLKSNYIDKINKLDINKYVKFIGYLNLNQKKFFYKNCDLIVIPSIITSSGDREGLPTVLLEAMYNGAVTLSSYQSNAHEIIQDSENGFLFDYEKISIDKDKIFYDILNLNEDAKEIISKNAKNTIIKYKSENIANLFFNHLFK